MADHCLASRWLRDEADRRGPPSMAIEGLILQGPSDTADEALSRLQQIRTQVDEGLAQ